METIYQLALNKLVVSLSDGYFSWDFFLVLYVFNRIFYNVLSPVALAFGLI
jgi:hypothetical protein